MDNDTQEHAAGSSKFHTVQPLRDLESNWAVDLAQNLEDYLLKICSGEITAGLEDAHFSVNFAEAALLLQGSIQVYSRKVEYLYNLVLHALEFISQTRSQENVDSTSHQQEPSSSRAVQDEDDQFWVSDDIPVEEKNCLDNATSKDTFLDHFVKPPANLVVLEGDCLDSNGDGGELDSYLLATNDLYCDFILLDPCDATAVDEFLKDVKSSDIQYSGYRGSSLTAKAHKSFMSPFRRSVHKSSAKKGQDHVDQASPFGAAKENPNNVFGPGPSNFTSPDNGNYGFETDDHHSHHEDFDDSGNDDDDDPWKPLNPHEAGNLKVKPFRKVKVRKRTGMTKKISVASQFPFAKLNGTVCAEFTEIWEMRFRARKRQQESQPPSLYEKLRGTLVDEHAHHDAFHPPDKDDVENIFDDEVNDFDHDDFDMPDVTFMDEQVNLQQNKEDDFVDHHYTENADTFEDPNSQPNLEDLCRAHLDALLASISENEKQTELAARVSTWKQRIENDLEEEDSRPPFDIHIYGETVLDKLSMDDGVIDMSFTNVVKGQEKHDIARTFSALLQLVNDRKVDLDRGTSSDDSFCYTAVNPFNVRLLNNSREPRKMQFQVSKKRPKSTINGKYYKRRETDHLDRQSPGSSPSSASKSPPILSQPTCKLSAKMKSNGLKTTPDGKRRRRSRLAESDLESGR